MKFTREQCRPVVEFYLNQLRPFCEMMEAAGSWRRERPFLGDLEIVFSPRFEPSGDDWFSTRPVDLADRQIETWLASGVIEKRLAQDGRISSWARLNKHAVDVATGIPVDFFCEPDARDWWRTLVIRTGPKELNIRLMAAAPSAGIIPHAYGPAFFDARGNRVFAASEREVLSLCGIPWLDPKDRK